MDEADLTQPQPQTKNGVKVKTVNKSIIGVKRNHYNAFTGAGALAYTLLEKNPKKTLEQLGQLFFRKRIKTYIPRTFDVPAYEKEELAKQMDLEIMTITINPDTYRPHTNQFLNAKIYRTITREKNEEGQFRRLTIELEEIAR